MALEGITSGSVLSDTQIALYMLLAGFPPKPRVIAEGIATVHAESGGDPKSKVPGNEHMGLWAESSAFGSEAERLDPYHSTVAARKQWQQSGGSFYDAWGRWEAEQAGTNGATRYKTYLPAANKGIHVIHKAAVADGKKPTSRNVDFGPQDLLPGGLGKSILEEFGIHIPNLGGALPQAEEGILKGKGPSLSNPLQGVEETANAVGDTAQFLGEAAKLLFTPEGWLQIGQVTVGIFLIGWGVHHIITVASGVDPTRAITKTATKAAEVAAVVK